MEGELPLSFDLVANQLDFVSSRDVKEQLLQYNLDHTLQVAKFRVNGRFDGQTPTSFEDALKAFFGSSYLCAQIGCSGEANVPVNLELEPLGTSVMNMEFFDRFTEVGIVSAEGKIRGCFDETYDGITVGDLLREFLLNPESENASAFSTEEQQELIFQIFRLFAVGGALCQPEDNINKYLTLTKTAYKEIVTVFRNSSTNAVQVSGKAFKVKRVDGVDLFPDNPTSPHSVCIAVLDPLKKHIVFVKNTFKDFW